MASFNPARPGASAVPYRYGSHRLAREGLVGRAHLGAREGFKNREFSTGLSSLGAPRVATVASHIIIRTSRSHMEVPNGQGRRHNPTNAQYFKSPLGQPHRLPSSLFGLKQPPGADLQQHQYRIWMSTILDYARRDLMYAKDCLPSLAGLASGLQAVWQDTYLAGMWRRCLFKQLVW